MVPNLLHCILPLLQPRKHLHLPQKPKELELHYYTPPRVPIPGLYARTRKYGLVLCYIREQPHYKKNDRKEFQDLFISRAHPVLIGKENEMQKNEHRMNILEEKDKGGSKLKLVDGENYYLGYTSSLVDGYDSGYGSTYDSSREYGQESQSQVNLSNQEKEGEIEKKIPYLILEDVILVLSDIDLSATTTSTTSPNQNSSYESSRNYSQESHFQMEKTEEKNEKGPYIALEETLPILQDFEINRFDTNTNRTSSSTSNTPQPTSPTNPTLSSILSSHTTPHLRRPSKIDTDNYLLLHHPLPTQYNTILSRPAFVAETQSRTYTFQYGGKTRRFFLLDDGLSFILLPKTLLPKPKLFTFSKKNKKESSKNKKLYKVAAQGSGTTVTLIQQTPLETEKSWKMIEECKNDFLGVPDDQEKEYCERVVKFWLRGEEKRLQRSRLERREDVVGH